MPRTLQITNVPDGEAPQWVREMWVGLSVPIAQRDPSPLSVWTFGVLSGPRNIVLCWLAYFKGDLRKARGYLVEVPNAIDALAVKSPEAAAWWRTNTPHLIRPRRYFVFQQADVHVID
ncbi:hypothetical protein [Ideonella margarita]|uniref:Uncharacterized protein n=1 Tax=Ideonella margarita TaxID=2984191 RepID=A0ABU9CBC4_9BURK